MKATKAHYFFANGWPAKIWMAAVPTLFAAGAVMEFWSGLFSPSRLSEALISWGGVLASILLGWFVGILVGWFVIGPLYYDRNLKNGEPFHKGEVVQILVGPHRDRLVQVVETYEIGSYAGAHRVRVDLGGELAEGENVFTSTEILRVEAAAEPPLPIPL